MKKKNPINLELYSNIPKEGWTVRGGSRRESKYYSEISELPLRGNSKPISSVGFRICRTIKSDK